MKRKNISSYIWGGLMVLFALILFCEEEVGSRFAAVSFVFLAILILPTFKLICKKTNRQFSTGRKIGLGIGTFMIPPVLFSSEEMEMSYISAVFFVIIMFWVIMFATNRNEYNEVEEVKIVKKSDKKDIFHRIYNKMIEKRNAKAIELIRNEHEIRSNLLDLNIMTIHAIAKMLSETRDCKNNSIYQDIPEVNLCDIVLEFCKDSHKLESEYELKNLYTKEYYRKKINKCCPDVAKFIRDKIREALPSNKKGKYIEFFNSYLDIFLGNMESFSSMMFYRTVSTYGEDYTIEKQFGSDSIDYRFKDSFIYLINLLSACTCISKMIFIEKKVKNLKQDNEFYKIVSNMAKEINDIDLIIKKTRPIYDEFYQSQLGYINDELLYGIAIANLSNRIINKPLSKKDENIVNIGEKKYNDFELLDNYIKEWIYELSDKHRNLEINKYIIFKITNSIDLENIELYLNALERMNEYSNLYYSNVEFNNKKSDKERYLEGNFDKEKEELSGKYSLNNITTGTQFELYLVNLFKDLGYKAKHNGKAGDQGADLILKMNDYVYVVQAKYYTGKLGNTPVQEIVGALKYYNANQGVVITNSSFTPGAEELAKANNVILIDGKDLKKLADYVFEDEHDEDILKKFEK